MKIRPKVPALVSTLLVLAACASTTGARLTLTEAGRLAPCGAAPNCVSSDETGARRIEPLALGGDPAAAWRALTVHLENQPSLEIEVREEGYLRVVARTRIFRFADDVEFALRPEAAEIAMRSASRFGFSDFGKNRRRLEAIRRALTDAKALAAGG